MKIRSDLHAGYTTVQECQADAKYWKTQAKAMQGFAKTGKWPAGLPYPTKQSQTGGGYVGGVWYPDRSGACG
jgi:hypothetical protein